MLSAPDESGVFFIDFERLFSMDSQPILQKPIKTSKNSLRLNFIIPFFKFYRF